MAETTSRPDVTKLEFSSPLGGIVTPNYGEFEMTVEFKFGQPGNELAAA